MERRIAHITDTHLEEKGVAEKGVNATRNFLKLLEDVATINVNEILFGGDIGEASIVSWFFDRLYQTTSNVKITLGNHDKFDEVVKTYSAVFNAGSRELYFSEDDPFFRYIYLDTSSHAVSAEQFEWFVNQMETVKPVILFIHHPVLPVETEMDNRYPLIGRERIQLALRQHNKKVCIFSGHYHTADEQSCGNIAQYVTPATSFQVMKQKGMVKYDTVNFGYRTIIINEDRINTQVVWLI
jgi:Icc protein